MVDHTTILIVDDEAPIREMIADQKLGEARDEGDAAGVAAAERELQRLRSLREVQP